MKNSILKSTISIVSLLFTQIYSFVTIEPNSKQIVKYPGGTVNIFLNTSFYLGKTYEYAYDKYYWTIGMVRFYNSTFNKTSEIFAQTTYIFLENEWAGSKEDPLIFKIDPVSFFKNIFF